MKQQNINLSHHCQSIPSQNNGKFACNRMTSSPQPMTRCDGTCFQRNFYQQEQQQYPSFLYHPVSFITAQPWSVMPLACYPSFHCPCHEPPYFEKIKSKQKNLDPCSYRVTVRRITPLHVADVAAEAYRAQSNKDTDAIPLHSFNQIVTSSHQKLTPTPTTNIYERDYLDSDNQNIPSVPSKKIVPKNNGLQVSSTSFITTTDDQKSVLSDNAAEMSLEHHMIPTRRLNELSFSMTEVDKSDNDSFGSSQLNSILPTINSINPMTINRKEEIMTNKNVDTIANKNQSTKPIELSIVEEHSSVKPQPTIDKVETYGKHSINEKLSLLDPKKQLKLSNDFPIVSHHRMLNIITPESIMDPVITDNSHRPTLPSSLPPNIDNIKSNEMLINTSRSIKSITSLTNEKGKSSIDTRQPSLPLRTTRSTLDFGLLIHETTTENF